MAAHRATRPPKEQRHRSMPRRQAPASVAASGSSFKDKMRAPILGTITRMETFGLGSVRTRKSKSYDFKFDKILGYKGQSLGKLNMKVGTEVKIRLEKGDIVSSVTKNS